MRKSPLTTVLICLIINLLDGFDVLAISFAAPSISDEWALDPQQLGVLLSAGLAGMVLGSIVLGGVADYLGRYRTILICLGVITLAMVGSAMAAGTTSLAGFRFIVGLGVGTILPSLNTLVAEYSAPDRRELAVSLMQAGYPAGAILGGVVAVLVIGEFGWRGVFWTGAGMSLVVLILAAWLLPESEDYLALRRAQASGEPAAVMGYRGLIERALFTRVLLLSGAFFFVMASFYFVASWTPKLLVDAGLNLTAGISGGVVLSVGGMIGGLVLGWLAPRFGALRLTAIYMCTAVPLMFLFAGVADLAPMLVAAFVMGFFLLGSMVGLYVVTPGLFESSTRATATGVAVGLGRFGAILGPLLTGYLLAADWSGAELYQLFAVPMFISAAVVLLLRSKHSSEGGV